MYWYHNPLSLKEYLTLMNTTLRQLPPLTDPVYTKPEKFTSLEKFFLRFMKDERDLPFIHLSLKITFSLLPIGILLYMPFVNGWWFAGLVVLYHYFNNFVFKGPFGLMLHCTSHRALFKREYNWMNYYIPWVLAPFFGHSPETYFTHHIGMHHPENNMPDDDSSTLEFQRDSKRDFFKYFGRFILIGVYDLCIYFSSKNRKSLLVRTIRGELLFFAFCIAMCFVNWQATLFVFILPMFIYRLVAMMGNWAQHAFIDASDPDNGYKNSITCVNTVYNHKCWNDGYHISHHVKPSMHYTEHPGYFLKTIDEYKKQESIVFDGIHFLHVFFWLMQKRYDKLAKAYVNIGNRFNSQEEVMVFLKQRTAKVNVEAYNNTVHYPFKHHLQKRVGWLASS